MSESFTDRAQDSGSREHALKCLDLLYNEYRSAEQYLRVITAVLLGILAYLWKDFSLDPKKHEQTAVYSLFILLLGVNIGIGLVYTWYLGAGISVCDYENKLQWLPVRPFLQSNLGIMGRVGSGGMILLTPLLIPALAGIISGAFFFVKFVWPVYFKNGWPQAPFSVDQWCGIVMTVAMVFAHAPLTIPVTMRFRTAVLAMLPPRGLEMRME